MGDKIIRFTKEEACMFEYLVMNADSRLIKRLDDMYGDSFTSGISKIRKATMPDKIIIDVSSLDDNDLMILFEIGAKVLI